MTFSASEYFTARDAVEKHHVAMAISEMEMVATRAMGTIQRRMTFFGEHVDQAQLDTLVSGLIAQAECIKVIWEQRQRQKAEIETAAANFDASKSVLADREAMC